MVLFNIPDIRLFWSDDPRFLSQFRPGQITQFKPYSKYPPCYKDMSFWLPPATVAIEAGSDAGGGGDGVEKVQEGRKEFHENDYCEIVREVAGDLVETVTLVSTGPLRCHSNKS
jgi:phenylalanyl-tRNA synthetase alpha chain